MKEGGGYCAGESTSFPPVLRGASRAASICPWLAEGRAGQLDEEKELPVASKSLTSLHFIGGPQPTPLPVSKEWHSGPLIPPMDP